jgi:small subunit ribosomal protein S6
MREYEVTVILNAGLEDDTQKDVLGRVEGWLTEGMAKGVEVKSEHWGHRTLAYPINKQTDGYYIYYEVALDPAKISEIERNFTYMDEILRHLVVRKED